MSEIPASHQPERPDVSGWSEDQLEEYLDHDPKVAEITSQIMEARSAGNQVMANALVEQNRAERARLRDELVGESQQQLEAEIEQARRAEVEQIAARLTGEETDDELLRAYKLTDHEGKISAFSINAPVFRTTTQRAFQEYLRFVDLFNGFAGAEAMTGTRVKGIGEADKKRTEAHNVVAHSVAEDLGMEFDVSRRLVAKMRDGVFPGSSETAAYSMALRRGVKLSEKYGGDAAAFAEDELRRIKYFAGEKHES